MSLVWSPLAPSPSGIANYVETLIADDPDFDGMLFVTEDGRQREGRNAVPPDGEVWNQNRALLELGNNRYHGYVLERARLGGAIIELHDLSLHHLHAEMTLGRSDFPGYLSGLQEAEGEWGRRLAYQRAKGYFTPRLEYELRVNKAICQRAEAVIVHSRWARFQIETEGVDTPVYVIPRFAVTPDLSEAQSRSRAEARDRLSLDPEAFTILWTGRVTPPNRVDWVLDAFEGVRDDGVDARLIIAGACEDDGIAERVRSSRHADAIMVTGYLGAAMFDEYLLAADIIPVLPFPSAGGSSAVVARALGFGRLVMVPDYAAFSDLPDDVCEKIYLDRPVVEQMVDIFAFYADAPDQQISREMRATGYAQRHLGLHKQREALKGVLDRHWSW